MKLKKLIAVFSLVVIICCLTAAAFIDSMREENGDLNLETAWFKTTTIKTQEETSKPVKLTKQFYRNKIQRNEK